MPIQIPVITASGAKSTITLPDPTVGGTPPPTSGPSPAYYAQWSKSGPLSDPAFFPVGAWVTYLTRTNLIAPYNTQGMAKALVDAGFNIQYVDYGWFDSTAYPSYALPHAQAAQAAGLKLIVGWKNSQWFLTQNPTLAPIIIGYFDKDEPDMTRANFHDANSAWQIQQDLAACHAQDSTRPMFVNLGKAFGCYNTGTFTLTKGNNYDTGTKDGDLTLYVSSADAVSVDTYWWTDDYEVTTGAWMYGLNVDNVRRFSSNPAKPIMGFVESSREQPTNNGPTADQMEAAIWNQIVHGARGIMYFNTDTKDGNAWDGGVWVSSYFNRVLGDQIIARMKTVHSRIKSLAPVLNSPQLGTVNSIGREVATSLVTVTSTSAIPVDVMVRKFGGQTYVFAQASGDQGHQLSGNTTATFTYPGSGSGSVTVRDESRTINRTNGVWSDTFTPYQLHIYVF